MDKSILRLLQGNQPHFLCEKLIKINVYPSIILLVLGYLTSRPQFVRFSSTLTSNTIKINNGVPQGTVLSPFFALYIYQTADLNMMTIIDKSAVNTVLAGLITNNQDLNYKEKINFLADWCDRNHLVLNTSKTKKTVFDFCRQENNPETIITKEKEVEQVETFKYLGVVLDYKLMWKNDSDVIVSKIKTRMYCLRNSGLLTIQIYFKFFVQ